jgi:hypothetical protein
MEVNDMTGLTTGAAKVLDGHDESGKRIRA